jgi:predicted nicotinamide N-methyase
MYTHSICDSSLFSLFSERTNISYVIEDKLNRNSFTLKINSTTEPDQKDTKLFVNHIWPGSIVLADFICENYSLFRSSDILEIGAGAGLPSLVVSKIGNESRIVCTDYPRKDIIENLTKLCEVNDCPNVTIEGHIWGEDPENLLKQTSNKQGFDIILLAELLWKDTYALQKKLLQSVRSSLKKSETSKVYLSFATRECDGFSSEQVYEFLQSAETEFGFSVSLIKTDSTYKDAMDGENIEVSLYLLKLSDFSIN